MTTETKLEVPYGSQERPHLHMGKQCYAFGRMLDANPHGVVVDTIPRFAHVFHVAFDVKDDGVPGNYISLGCDNRGPVMKELLTKKIEIPTVGYYPVGDGFYGKAYGFTEEHLQIKVFYHFSGLGEPTRRVHVLILAALIQA